MVVKNYLIDNFIIEKKERINKVIAHYLRESRVEYCCVHSLDKLYDAISYSTCDIGKRLRPLLVYAAGESLNVNVDCLDALACAVEFLHAASLIHDDLPIMDNDDFRRGKPSCHKAYGNATALLSGDALPLLGIEVVYKSELLSCDQKITATKYLLESYGICGVIGGQHLDALIDAGITKSSLHYIYTLKTSSLLKASVLLGAFLSKQIKDNDLITLGKYAENIGIAFQLQDDLSEFLQKSSNDKEYYLKKTPYPALFGVSDTKEEIKKLFDEAIQFLAMLELDKSLLAEFTGGLITL